MITWSDHTLFQPEREGANRHSRLTIWQLIGQADYLINEIGLKETTFIEGSAAEARPVLGAYGLCLKNVRGGSLESHGWILCSTEPDSYKGHYLSFEKPST